MCSKMNGIPQLKLLKNVSCVTCNNQFYIKDFTFKGSKCPMLLHCGHSICEGCLQQNLKAMKCISCPQCGFVSSLDSLVPVNECFPLSLYVVGSVVTFQNYKHGKDSRLAFLTKNDGIFNYAVKGQSDMSSKSGSSGNVCEECSLTAIWFCENCKSNFCEICWSKVHISAKSLMKHCKSAICKTESEIKNGLKKCSQHENMDLEFFCKGCSTTVCSYCVILQHQGKGHYPITLKEKNMEMINQVTTATEEAEKLSKRMKQTLEKIKLSQNFPDTPSQKLFSDLGNQITKNFSRIHGILQLEEERLLKELQKNFNERENCIKTLKTQLEKQMENVENLLLECHSALKKPQNVDLIDLHRQLTEVQDLPCYLISKSADKKEAKIEFNDSLVESVRLYCKLELPSNELYELRSGSDLPEDYAVESLTVSDLEQKPKEGLESCVSDLDTFSNDSRSSRELDALLPKVPKEPKTKVFFEKKNYSVRVSYIKNPGEFYVTLNSQRAKQQTIDKNAFQFASCSSHIPKTFAKDEVYLVQYNVDKKWYRARVVEVLSNKKINGEGCVLVYYLDYGNLETVPISKLRHIPSDMLEEPPLAVKCRLFDCVPKSGKDWCVESTKTMEKILNDYTATMFVMKVHHDCLEVDLSVIYPEGQIGRDIVSVRDALLFLEYSSFVRGSKVPRNATAFKYLHQCLPTKGEIFDAVITHVNSPFDFFIQKTKQDASYLYKLTIDLQNYYCENSEKNILYNPTAGMPCAARFSVDQRWYRAKIIDVPGQKMVTVFYVDYGNKETIPWTSIRKLKETFVKRPPLALNCSLAGILPTDVFWNAQTISYLENCIMSRDCRVHVQSRPKSKQKLKVVLYQQVKKEEICVNSLFLDLGYAVKSSSHCLRMLKPRKKGKDAEAEKTMTESLFFGIKEEKSNSEREEDKSSSDVDNNEKMTRKGRSFKRDPKRSKLSAKELRELYEYEKKTYNAEDFSTEEVESEIDEYSDIFRMKVEVLSAESPSCIYVTFPTLIEELKNLQVKLNEFYQNSSAVAGEEWTEGSLCIVFDSSKGSWYRASVLCILPNDLVKVFLKDIAQVSTVPVSALRQLDSSFTKYPTCAVKCHLADIRSPGTQWPSISCEYLVAEIEKYTEVYMTKKGQIENRSLPVELWVQKIVTKGALEPITKEWITLNRLLVHQGLAIPTKSKLWDVNSSAHEGCSENEKELEASVEVTSNKESTEVSNVFVPSLSCQWNPPEPLKRSRFVAMATYVDFNSLIYAYDVEQDEEDLKMIREILVKEFAHSQPNPEDHFWSPGQMCVVRYHVDNFWYRGQIVKINEDLSCEVLFVDYGNIETCQASDLRKRIKMRDIPVLTHTFKLHRIEPTSEDGSWPVPVIDILHSLVVDKKCEIVILKSPLDPSDAYLVTLKILENDTDIGMFLVSQGLASLKCIESDSCCSSDADVLSSDESLPLVSFTTQETFDCDSEAPGDVLSKIPDKCNEFFVEVTCVTSETEFFANIVDDESLSSGLKKLLNQFEDLQKKLTEQCHLQPLLENLTKGQPCCCVCSKSNKWCRGEVESFMEAENLVCVVYVDYGNKELHLKDLIHECKNEWMTVPKMALKCRLANVKKCPDVSKSVYMKALATCIKEAPLFAEISNKNEDVLEVRLLTKRNGPFVYQEMIEKKLMICVN